jgi:hypothetical protein
MRIFRTLSFFYLAALLAAAPLAHADSIFNVSDLENHVSNPLPPTVPAVAPTDTFTASNTTGNIFSFNFTGASSESIINFLHSGGDTILDTGGIGQNDPINNVLFYIAGFVDLAPGTYNIQHNGAMYFSYIVNEATGPLLISSSDPTAGITTSSFTISADTGSVYATLLYADSTTATPEPSSFVLLGSGLLAAAGLVRRRMAA